MNEELLKRIELVLGIKFKEWQRKYLLKEPQILDLRSAARRSGKTLVYMIEKLYASDQPIRIRGRKDLLYLCDWYSVGRTPEEALNGAYDQWFKHEIMRIREKLDKAGLNPREIIWKA